MLVQLGAPTSSPARTAPAPRVLNRCTTMSPASISTQSRPAGAFHRHAPQPPPSCSFSCRWVRHRANLPVRQPGGDHHPVGETRRAPSRSSTVTFLSLVGLQAFDDNGLDPVENRGLRFSCVGHAALAPAAAAFFRGVPGALAALLQTSSQAFGSRRLAGGLVPGSAGRWFSWLSSCSRNAWGLRRSMPRAAPLPIWHSVAPAGRSSSAVSSQQAPAPGGPGAKRIGAAGQPGRPVPGGYSPAGVARRRAGYAPPRSIAASAAVRTVCLPPSARRTAPGETTGAAPPTYPPCSACPMVSRSRWPGSGGHPRWCRPMPAGLRGAPCPVPASMDCPATPATTPGPAATAATPAPPHAGGRDAPG